MEKLMEKAAKEQNLKELAAKLEQIVPDIRNQYSSFKLNDKIAIKRVRYLHAFQISLIKKILDKFKKSVVIVDIGDSSGTHLQYVRGLYSQYKNIKSLSVNIDAKAVEKIKEKGFEAKKIRGENVESYDISADIFLCFETLEHLMDPCRFLYALSSKTNVKYLIITIPYVRKSCVGLTHIRSKYTRTAYVNTTRIFDKKRADAETTHIFEFNPEDWKLIVKHSGWDVKVEKIYLQYPKKGIFGLGKLLWRRLFEKIDFEGCYGLILSRNNYWSKQYVDW